MSRRRRLLGKVRKQPQREARKWRCRAGRQLRRELAASLASLSPPEQPWGDPAYQSVMADIRANLEGKP
jgi:hypothetical protein